MSEFSTPRKRKAVDGAPLSDVKGRQRGPPTPNPPLMPFPTPRSRSRKAEYVEPDLDIFSPSTMTSPRASASTSATSSLPSHLQTLLTLHHAFNVALSLHIATHPPVLPPHAPNTTSVKLPNLTNIIALRESIERTGGRRFGVPELQRLAWLWTWDGEDPDRPGVKREEEENPFLVSASPGQSSTLEVCELGYIVTPTRTLDGSGRRVYTYGVGIELELRPGETRQLLHGGSEGGIGNKGQGGGMGAVGRWNGGGEEREAVVRDKLDKWVRLHGGFEAKPEFAIVNGIATPTNTRENSRSTIPPIPLLPLPALPASTLLPSANLFSSPTFASSPHKSSPARAGPAVLADPFVLKENDDVKIVGKDGKPARPGSVEERRSAMMDRIKARKGQSTPLPTLGSAIATGPQYSLSKADTQEELKRRSTLSRLEGVAEAVWMIFSAPPPSASVSLTPPRTRRKAIPMAEAAEIIVKSSKTPISIAEAQSSLALLTDLCPFFLQLKTIARSEWLEMPPQVASIPPSPGSSLLGSSAASANAIGAATLPKLPPMPESPTRTPTRTPSSRTPGRTPVTPGRAAMVAAMEFGMGSPGGGSGAMGGGAIAGPASPGRVRRAGGLREVRERIRRELGK